NIHIRLNTDRHSVGTPIAHRFIRESIMRWRFELDDDMGFLHLKAFAGTDVKRNPLPTPIINKEASRCIGLHIGSLGDTFFIAVSNYLLPVVFSGTILAPHRIFNYFLWIKSA